MPEDVHLPPTTVPMMMGEFPLLPVGDVLEVKTPFDVQGMTREYSSQIS
jgi:hypothetical protein